MYKICLLAFVLLSHEARASGINRYWEDKDWYLPGNFPKPNPPATRKPNGGSISESVIFQNCLRKCPVTPEYNPVCGTDNVTYDNPGRLLCAQSCGANVTKLRSSPCPNASTVPPA